MALNDYCYVIRSQAGGDNFYVGQSTVPLNNLTSFKNRMYTHALAACGVSGYGKTVKDFRSLEKAKNCDGIDKVWHDQGFEKSTFYIFNRPGVDTLQESAKMLLNYGFWAGVKSENENSDNFSFSSGYSANIGEILLVDYFSRNKSSVLPGSTMANAQAGGQSSTAVSYNPARSRWGKVLLNGLDSETLKVIRTNWKLSYTKGGYKVAFTGGGAGKTVERLSKFLDNPLEDTACCSATNNFLRDLVTIKLKQRILNEISVYVFKLLLGEIKASDAEDGSVKIPLSTELKEVMMQDLSSIENQLNQNSYIRISFKLNPTESYCTGSALKSLINKFQKKLNGKTIDESKLGLEIQEAVNNWISSINKQNKPHYRIFFKVDITHFEFIGHESLYSTLEREVNAVKATKDLTDIHTAIALGTVDALKYYIYHTPQDRKGILYGDSQGDQKVLRYALGHDGDASYYNFLKSQAVELGMFKGSNLSTWFDPLYKLAMKEYRETLGKKFVTTTISTNNKPVTYLFSNTSISNNYIPTMDTISVNNGSTKVGTTLSDANNIYFIKGDSAISRWLDFENATPDLQKLIQVLF